MENATHNRRKAARYTALALGTVALAGLTACSSDNSFTPQPDVPSTTADANVIRYNVVANNAARGMMRAASIYNANNIPNQFYVSAWAMDGNTATTDDGNMYIKNDLIKNQGTATAQNWVDQSGLRYWPNNGELLNFFATNATNASIVYDESGQGASTVISNPKYEIPLTVASAGAQQTDLLYASVYDQKKTATGATGQTSQPVTLDFHHALSQVVFTAQCTNPHIEVKIGSISVVGVAGTGILSIPADRNTSAASWSVAANYTPATFGSDPDGDRGAVTVGSTVTPITSDSDQTDYALMIIPQTVAAADPTATDAWTSQKAYLKVQCTIFNVAKGENGSETSDTMIFGTNTDMGGGFIRQDYGTLYIPLAVNWEMGKRYVYNLQFGTGNGGYNQDGTLALIPIKYNVTADNWTEAGSSNVQEPTGK